MSRRAPGRVLGLPTDRLFAAYLLVAGGAFAFAGRPAAWQVLLATHLLAAAVLWPVPVIGRAAARLPERARRLLRPLIDWLPLLALPALYTELAVLNRAVHGGRYFDTLVIEWEQLLFGGQPSRDWAGALPSLWISEALHFAYLSYYFIVLVPPLLLFLRGRTAEFRFAVFALMLSFFVHYVFFIYFPVQGPRYLFPAPVSESAAGPLYALAHRVLEAGSAQGAAFPSSHVGVSVTQTLIALRFMPRLAPLLAVLTVGLATGAVYGGFHYATDAIAGAVLGALALLAARRLYSRPVTS